jgi:hypothetical protein
MNAENPVQMDPFGVSATRTKDTRLAERIGGSRSLLVATSCNHFSEGPRHGRSGSRNYLAAPAI